MQKRILGILGLVGLMMALTIIGVRSARADVPAVPATIDVGLFTDEPVVFFDDVPVASLPQAPNAPAAELHVCPSGCAYASIQDAVDAAGSGDVIKVAVGTYTDVHVRPRRDIVTTGAVTQVVYVSKTVAIEGGYTMANWTTPDPEANPTTLDAQGQGRVLYITGDVNPTITGLRITGGDATGMGGWPDPWLGGEEDAGGGIYVITASAVITNNWVFSNTAQEAGGAHLIRDHGTFSGNSVTNNTSLGHSSGGLLLYESATTVSGNTIAANVGTGISLMFNGTTVNGNTITGNDNGGMWLFINGSTLIGNTIMSNTSNEGGGVRLRVSDATLIGNTIAANSAITGGGVCLYDSRPTLISNVISANTVSRSGGGLYIQNSAATLDGNTIISNTAGEGGGGVCMHGEHEDGGSNTLRGNTIVSNTATHGGGVNTFFFRGATLDGNTISGNNAQDGGGLLLFISDLTLDGNTITANDANGTTPSPATQAARAVEPASSTGEIARTAMTPLS